MPSTKLRAVIASEDFDARKMIGQVLEADPNVVLVGQAENALTALTLARHLRPDLVMVDSDLPHVRGVDTIRLSRISGLDTAMDIFQELPKARVVLLSDLSVALDRSRKPNGDTEGYLYYAQTPSGPIELHQLYAEADRLLFARLAVTAVVPPRRRIVEACDRGVLYGGLAVLGGLGLMLTLIMAGPGAVLAMAGAASLALGLAGRAIATWWPRRVAPVQRTVEASVAKKPKAA